VIDATGVNPLVLAAASFGSTGLVEATGAGGLVIDGVFANTESMDPGASGTVFAASGSSVALSGATVTGGTIKTAAGGSLQIDAGAASAIVNAFIADAGTVNVGAGGQAATLEIGGTVFLMSGGAFTLSDNAGTMLISNGSAAEFVNNRSVISGAGTIGDGNLSVVNRSSGVIDATGVHPLTLAGAGIGNAGLVEATGTGGLVVSATTLSNTESLDPGASGTVYAAPGSGVSLAGATIAGGAVNTALGGTLQIDAGAASTIENTFVGDHGTVLVGSAGQAATLEIGGTVYLMSGGAVQLADNAGTAIVGNGSAATLINVRTTITGAGTIGDANLAITNEGSGFIEATATHPLTVAGAGIENDGVLKANGGMLTVSAPVTGGGRAFVAGASTLDFGSSVAAGQTAIFQGAGGALVLDQSMNFHGKIGGFGGSDTIDLGDVLFAGTTAPGQVTQSGADTFVTVTEGATSVTLDLLNQPAGVSASHYLLEADSRTPHAGTLLAIG